jgi:hypothetical protein
MAITACAGYVIIHLEDPAATDNVLEILTDYTQAAGARVNTIDCNTDRTTGDNDYLGIRRRQETKILGVTLSPSTGETVRLSWMAVTQGTKLSDA